MIRSMVLVSAAGLLLASLAAAPAAAQARDGEGNPGAHYVVRPGQTLSVIAHDVLGDPDLWPAIYRANRDQIKDPTLLHVGQRLAIPEVSHDPGIRARIREEAIAFAAPPPVLNGSDVAAAPAAPPASATE